MEEGKLKLFWSTLLDKSVIESAASIEQFYENIFLTFLGSKL